MQRSGAKAQQTFAETYHSAVDQYEDERRAHQVAFASLKHTHEKVGDHWEPKDEYGPSDDELAEDLVGRMHEPPDLLVTGAGPPLDGRRDVGALGSSITVPGLSQH
ncbi:ChaB family protein [Lapillicoccus sp.]|uniref:ChaB family protein n=1 Tax=Lapillicoccus sp. TaxID=1909287 RepID=UPI00387EB897